MAALAAVPAILKGHEDEGNPALDRVAQIHGATGPFAVAGYRMGQAALRELKLRRGSLDVEVIHHAPRQVQWSCIIDGLQAATGASVGNLNLSLMESPAGKVFSVVRNRKTKQEIRMELTPAFVQQNRDLPPNKLAAAGVRISSAPEPQIFRKMP